jgi:hypothetical protein
VIPLVDVLGRVGTPSPEQIEAEVQNEKLGVIFGFTVTVKVVPVTHPPEVGVNI